MYNHYCNIAIVFSSVLALDLYSMQGSINCKIAPEFVSTCSCTQCVHEYILIAIIFWCTCTCAYIYITVKIEGLF